jgi:hypothetical protein
MKNSDMPQAREKSQWARAVLRSAVAFEPDMGLSLYFFYPGDRQPVSRPGWLCGIAHKRTTLVANTVMRVRVRASSVR